MGKEKKEIGKLLELLNEYKKEVKKDELYEWEKSVCGPFHLFVRDIYDEHHIYSESADTYAISKKYGFIKRLVENDKIDLDNEELVSLMSELGERRNPVKCLLMLLSIQDEPIRFLCEMLK